MSDAMISRVRMRDLARRGRFRPASGRGTASARACASRRESDPEASSLAAALPSRPRAASSRPGGGDVMASIIYREMMKTGVPIFTCRNSHSASEIRMRTHPCEAE
jgi:hypothetical protein